MSAKACLPTVPVWCLVLASLAGCCPSATFQIETLIRPDGSCTRSIWQPKKEFLPDEALTRAWNGRWEAVSGAPRPPRPPKPGAPIEEYKYIFARGSFRSPDDIPSHYRYVDEKFPNAGTSEIQRSYKRIDYGFVVEHRWKEKITNIVTLPDFLKARDELLDLTIPLLVQAIDEELGDSYDVSQLVAYVRADGRRFLEQLSVTLYDVAAQHRPEAELVGRVADVTNRFGLNLRDEKGNVVSDQQLDRRLDEFLRRLLAKHVRHRDGRPLTRDEVDAILRSEAAEGASGALSKKSWEKRWERAEKRLGPIVLRMTGLYNPLAFLFQGIPRYQFTIQLPGQLIETNGVLATHDRVIWRFTSNQLFPNGYEMKARSVVLNREAQKKIFGRLVISDGAKAAEFIELVGEDGPLFKAVRKVYEAGDLSALREIRTRSAEEFRRANKLQKMLLGE